MLGHQLVKAFGDVNIESYATIRSPVSAMTGNAESKITYFSGVEAFDFGSLSRAILLSRADVVINCIGVRASKSNSETELFAINADLPRRISEICKETNAKFIHISTDGVFSGDHGPYRDHDLPDAPDPYGQSKANGEITAPHVLNLRLSFIGPERGQATGLFAWALGQRKNTISGYVNVFTTALTSPVIARWLVRLVQKNLFVPGTKHLAGPPISKFELLQKLNTAFDLGIEIEPAIEPRSDRRLICSEFQDESLSKLPSWDEMIEELRMNYDA